MENALKYPETYSPSLVHGRESATPPMQLRYQEGTFPVWHQQMLERLREAMGMHRMPSNPPDLNPVSIWKKEFREGTVEKIRFTCEEGCEAPVYLCLPSNPVRKPFPFFLCLAGHGTGMHRSIARDIDNEDVEVDVPGDRDFALECMRRGIGAICLEQRGFGERREFRYGTPHADPTCGDASGQALLLGRTLIGERVFDVARTIELLRMLDTEREEVSIDFERLGCLGNSGGGTVTIFATALLPEIRLAMPSSYFCSFAASIQAMPHCICNFIPGLLEFAEAAEVAGLIAPRPLVILNGREDPIFPIDGAVSEFARLRQIYADAGAPDHVKHVIGEGGHRFYAEQGWKEMLPFVLDPTKS